MKKLFVLILTLMLLVSVTFAALGFSYSIQAENGAVLPPSGLNFDLNGQLAGDSRNLIAIPELQTSISYGAFPILTIAGELEHHEGAEGLSALVKAYLSPNVGKKTGYTVYLGYDLGQGRFPMYGVSLWSNLQYLYAFANLEMRTASDNTQSFQVTPGASLRLSQNMRVNGELELNPANWSIGKVRMGANYLLNQYMSSTFFCQTGFNGEPLSLGAGVNLKI